MKTLIGNTLASLKENFSRVFNYIYCALIVLGVYFVFMFTLNLVAHDLIVTDKNGDTFFSFLGEYSWWIIYAVAYGIPLYYIHFKKGGELKTFVLHEMLRYNIGPDFPRITPESFVGGVWPLKITDITYTVDLSGMPYKPMVQGANNDI